VTVAAPATSATLTGLTNGATYTFAVIATNAFGDSLPAQAGPVTPGNLPNAPTDVSATAAAASATVSWVAPAANGTSPITGYTVTASPGGAQVSVGAALTAATVAPLTNGTAYTFTVVATNAVGDSAPSAPSNAVTPTAVPAPPTNVSAVVGTNGIVTISWTPPTDTGGLPLLSYTVSASPGPRAGTESAPATSMLMNAFTHQPYTFTVVATNSLGSSAPSAPSNAVTPITPPDPPTGVVATAGVGSATVTWTAPVNDNGAAITQYAVTTTPGFTRTFVDGSTTTATVTGLSHKGYMFYVQAYNAAGYGNPGTSNSVTPTTAPAAPTAVSALAGSGQATVTWSAPTDNGGSALTGYTVSASPDAGPLAVGPSATTVVFPGLTNDTPYAFAVTATNALGTGPASAPSPAVTPFGPPAATSSGLRASPSVAFASGDSPIALTATVKDAAGVPVRGQVVSLSSSVGADAFSFASGSTNAAGLFTSQVTGTTVGARTFTATVGADTLTATGRFVAGCTTSGFSAVAASPVTALGPSDLAVGDFDVDGNLDLVSLDAYSNSVSLFLGHGDGGFATGRMASLPTYASTGASPSSVVAADLDGDGNVDLAVSEAGIQGFYLSVLLGYGDGTFGTATPLTVASEYGSSQPTSLAAADLNGDGRLDLVMAFATDSGVKVVALLGHGDGTFSVGTPVLVASDFWTGGPLDVAVGDFDADGKPDVVTANSDAESVTMLLGNGDGTFGAPIASTTSYPSALALGDFDGNGKLDLAVAEGYGGSEVDVLLGHADGSFALPPLSSPAGAEPFSLQANDFNGDGRLDLIVADNDANTIDVLFGIGDGTFQAPLAVPVGSPQRTLVAGDFNGDGKPDLAAVSPSNASVNVLLNTCQ